MNAGDVEWIFFMTDATFFSTGIPVERRLD
jgi:hypothetical protein